MKLNEQKIREKLSNPAAVRLYDSIDSTNDEAKRSAHTDCGIVLYAASSQTAGRGRRGRSFYSPKDTGLYMTLSLPLSGADAQLQRLTCAAATAVCDAIADLSDRQPQIKWVNDIYLDGKKTAGILTELVTDSDNRPLRVIVGVGLNLNTASFPAEIADRAGNLGDIDPNLLCGQIAANLIEVCRRLDDHLIIEKYKQLNLCIGKTVTYARDGKAHTAKAVGIAADGGLIVEEKGTIITLNSGEISVVLS